MWPINFQKKLVYRFEWCLNSGFVTKDIDPMNSYTTTAVGDLICEFIDRHAKGETHPIHERLHKSTII